MIDSVDAILSLSTLKQVHPAMKLAHIHPFTMVSVGTMAVPGRSEQIKWHVSNYAEKRIKIAQVSLSTLFQSLQRYFRDPGFDQNTVRDSGKRNIL